MCGIIVQNEQHDNIQF